MLSDTLTVGLVLLLLFGSIALYLYTCMQQSEQKISLLESILLDLKMSTEVKSYTELPMESAPAPVSTGRITPTTVKDESSYEPFEDAQDDTDSQLISIPITNETLPAEELIDMDEYKSVIADAVNDSPSDSSVNYEAMSLKELQSLAKTRGIVGVTKKSPLIEALKTSDRSSAVKPGSLGSVGSNSFLETSASVSDETA